MTKNSDIYPELPILPTWAQVERLEREQEKEQRKEERKRAKAQQAWDTKYSKLKPQEVWKSDGGSWTRITFLNWVKETDDEVKTNSTTFTFNDKGAVEYMYTHTSKSQRFFVVGGHLGGQKVTEEMAGEGYQLYNCGSRDSGTPHVILVHKSEFKNKGATK